MFPPKHKEKTTQVSTDESSDKCESHIPVFYCICGAKILVVPDLAAMDKAIKTHLIEHKRVTGQRLTEEFLTREIIKALCKF